MNDLKQFTSLDYLQDYDIHVRRYLTLAQIQKIVNAVKIFDMWSERQQNIDLLTLVYATDITPEQIEELGHDILLESGLIDAVKAKIINFGDVQKAIEEIGAVVSTFSYSSACQTHDCIQEQKTGDCFGLSDYIAVEFAKKIAKAKKNGNIGKIEMNSDDIFNFAKEMYLKK